LISIKLLWKYPKNSFWVSVIRQNYQEPLGMFENFRYMLKMMALRWLTKLQRGFGKKMKKNFLPMKFFNIFLIFLKLLLRRTAKKFLLIFIAYSWNSIISRMKF